MVEVGTNMSYALRLLQLIARSPAVLKKLCAVKIHFQNWNKQKDLKNTARKAENFYFWGTNPYHTKSLTGDD